MLNRSRAFPFMLISVLAVHSAPCPPGCKDGSPLPLPDKMINVPPLPLFSCSAVETLAPALKIDESSEQCQFVKNTTTFCGCPKRKDACDLCPDGTSAPNPNTTLPVKIYGNAEISCQIFEAYLHSFSKEDDHCLESRRSAAATCGCLTTTDELGQDSGPSDFADPSDLGTILGIESSDESVIKFSSFGDDTPEKLAQLHRVLRSSAVLSTIGAILVILDTIRFKKRRKNLYNQIVVIMAGFDIVYSISISLIDIPRPTDIAVSSGTERGNAATCKAQGFFLQWAGLTSLFLNASLSTYYLLVIVYRARQSKLEQARKWMVGIPITVGTILACAAIPFITPGMIGCNISPPNDLLKLLEIDDFSTSWAPYLCLVVIPGYLVLGYTTVALGRVYWYVRDVSNKAGRWRSARRKSQFFIKGPQPATNSSTATEPIALASGSIEMKRKRTRTKKKKLKNKLQNEVFVQCAMYLAALYIVWFVTLWISIDVDRYLGGHYPLWNFLFFADPLQGFLNATIYFRPRLSRGLAQLWNKYCKSKMTSCCCKKEKASPPPRRNSLNSQPSVVEHQSWASIRESEPAADIVLQNERALEDTHESKETRNMARSVTTAAVDKEADCSFDDIDDDVDYSLEDIEMMEEAEIKFSELILDADDENFLSRELYALTEEGDNASRDTNSLALDDNDRCMSEMGSISEVPVETVGVVRDIEGSEQNRNVDDVN